MNSTAPDWLPFDPDAGELPDGLASAVGAAAPEGLLVVLIGSDLDEGWCADATLAIARALSAEGRNVFVADLHLDSPRLHDAAGVENDEGVSDVVLYGASVRRIARPIREGKFLLATAGTAVTDVDTVIESEEWDRILANFRNAGAVFLAHVKGGSPGAARWADRADGVVELLSEADESSLVDASVVFRMGPPGAMQPAIEVAEEEAAVELDTIEELDAADAFEDESVLDMGALAPSERESEEEVDVSTRVPEEPDEGSVLDVSALAPNEPQDEPVLDVGALAPSEPDEEPVLDMGALAPSEPEEEPVADMGALAPAEPEARTDVETGAAFEVDEPPAEPAEISATDEDGMFSISDLPPAADEPESADGEDLFSLDELSGSQYQAGSTADAGEEAPSGSEPMEPEPTEDEPIAAEAAGPDPAGPEEPEPTDAMWVDEGELDEVAAVSTMMEGLEVGSGFSMDEVDVGATEPADVSAEETSADPVEEPTESASDELVITQTTDEFGATAEDFAGDDMILDSTEEMAAAAAAAAQTEASPEPELGSASDAGPPAASVEDGAPPVEAAASGDGELEVREERRLSGLEKLERAQRRRNRTRRVGLIAASVGAVAVAAWGVMYSGIVSVPGITPPERMRATVEPPIQIPGPAPTNPAITHFLLTETYTDLATPYQLAEAQAAALPEYFFFVAPVTEGERTVFGLFAGPAFSFAQADSMKAPINEQSGNRYNSSEWRAVERHYGFFFGQYTTLDEARLRVDGLAGLAVPAYILQVDFEDETAMYRVYGGAYGDESEALPMAVLLREQGLVDIRLAELRGRRPE